MDKEKPAAQREARVAPRAPEVKHKWREDEQDCTCGWLPNIGGELSLDAKKQWQAHVAAQVKHEWRVLGGKYEDLLTGRVCTCAVAQITFQKCEIHVASSQPPAPVEHGFTCEKKVHVGTGHLHGPDDDMPYDVDGYKYCGRCHVAL